jgi:hypothetical protein
MNGLTAARPILELIVRPTVLAAILTGIGDQFAASTPDEFHALLLPDEFHTPL